MEELIIQKKSSYLVVLKFIIFHFALLSLAIIGYAMFMNMPVFHSSTGYMAFDSLYYNAVKTNGYSFNPSHESNVAFFPGFPYLWRCTGFNAYVISFLNLFIFILSFSVLAWYFAKKPMEIILFLSLPPMFFLYIPYSESLFFLTATVLLIGLYKRNFFMIILGLFLCSLTRSASNIFIPAIIATELFTGEKQFMFRNIILYVTAALAGVAIAVWVQFEQTGQIWGFMTTQKNWGVYLRKPEWPFHTFWGMDYLDGAALLVGAVVIYILIIMGWKFLKGQKIQGDKSLVFSLLYVAGLSIFPIIFKGSNLFSLNRYFIPTAFFFITGIYLVRLRQFSFKEVEIGFLIIFAFWMILFRGFRPISAIPAYFLISVYLSLYLLLNNKSVKIGLISGWLLYAINIFLQAHFFYRHINGHWVG